MKAIVPSNSPKYKKVKLNLIADIFLSSKNNHYAKYYEFEISDLEERLPWNSPFKVLCTDCMVAAAPKSPILKWRPVLSISKFAPNFKFK